MTESRPPFPPFDRVEESQRRLFEPRPEDERREGHEIQLP